MSIYSCKSCNIVSFATKQAYERHIVSQKHLKGSEDGTKKFICVCGKWFLYSSGLSAHKKKCKTHNNNNNESESVNINIENMQQKIEDFEKEREEMKAQIAMLLDKHAGITTNNNRTNIDTQNNTINIHINAFGNENTDYLDDKAILQCIDRVYKSIPAIIEKLHFNPQHPENHNIKITNKKLPYASVMGNNQRWKTVDRKDAIDKMVTNGYYMLDEKYETNKDKFDPRKQKNFETFKNNFETEEKNTMKMVKGDVEMLVINGP
jgi:hypothetical protein